MLSIAKNGPSSAGAERRLWIITPSMARISRADPGPENKGQHCCDTAVRRHVQLVALETPRVTVLGRAALL